ncbi:MAG: hypothetical protein K2Q18_15650 [Bdellovibrionales bacterium]|nr:hypothetical protein [Bdellovibrionales bacterium]
MGVKKILTLEDALDEINTLDIAFKREQKSREKAEQILEEKASNLSRVNTRLHEQYINMEKSNQEIDYLLKITKLDDEALEDSLQDQTTIIKNFLNLSSLHLWSEASFAFKCNMPDQKIEPVTSFILTSNRQISLEIEDKFQSECFSFLEIHLNSTKPLRYSKFSQEMKKINDAYSHLNHSYLCPLEIDDEEKYLIWFTFSNAIELDEITVQLVDRGIRQLKSTLQKKKSKLQLLDNYKKLKEIKSQLIQSEKMASIGTISAGIAHEINNPLSFLLTNSEVLREYLESLMNYINKLENGFHESDQKDKIKENIDYILTDTPLLMKESLEGIERIREIINGLRIFSRADDGEVKEFNVNSCIESSLRLVSNELKHKCKIGKKLESQFMVKGSEGQIIQVLTNLIVNGAQAIEEFGIIEINSRDEDGQVIISIKDNGKGISRENLNNLFTPFFTTKPAGQGTGLGLSISYGIVKRHNGTIQVESSLGIGTIFNIILPSTQG